MQRLSLLPATNISIFPSLKMIQDACKPPEKHSPFLYSKAHLPIAPSLPVPRLLLLCGGQSQRAEQAASILNHTSAHFQTSERPSRVNLSPCYHAPLILPFSLPLHGKMPPTPSCSVASKLSRTFITGRKPDHSARGQLITERQTPS